MPQLTPPPPPPPLKSFNVYSTFLSLEVKLVLLIRLGIGAIKSVSMYNVFNIHTLHSPYYCGTIHDDHAFPNLQEMFKV